MTATPTAVAKAEEAKRLAGIFQGLLSVHRESFPSAHAPVAPVPAPPDAAAVRAAHRAAALVGIGFFARKKRAAARERADDTARAELAALHAEVQRQQVEYQRELDAWWTAVLHNDPAAVLGALAQAFQDNEAAAAPVGVEGDEVSVVVLAPPESVVPERLPGTTAKGNLSLRKLPKGERAGYYTLVVMGHVVVTVKEALAVAPGLGSVRVVAVRLAGADAYGRPRLECLLAGRWTRHAFRGVDWATADAATVAQDTAAELLLKLRNGRELLPLDLTVQPQIRALLEVVDVGELTG